MNSVGSVIVVIFVVTILGLLAWVLISTSLVRVPSGKLGLLLVKGRATETTLPPGPHFVAALRRRMVVEYPSVELAYRAGAAENHQASDLEKSGPALRVALGDRATAVVPYTVRFRLVPDQLRELHERFGPEGIFGIVRDESSRAVAAVMGDPSVTVEDLFGDARETCQDRLTETVTTALAADGIEVTGFVLDAVDLGRTGEVIQATIRSRHELEQERAEAATRLARALNDAELEQRITPSSEAALRYRETDLLRDLVQRSEGLHIALGSAGRSSLMGLPGIDGDESSP